MLRNLFWIFAVLVAIGIAIQHWVVAVMFVILIVGGVAAALAVQSHREREQKAAARQEELEREDAARRAQEAARQRAAVAAETAQHEAEAAAEQQRRDEEKAAERERRHWRAKTFDPGPFSVILTGLTSEGAAPAVALFLDDLPGLRDQSAEATEALVESAMHVSPQPVAEAIAQHDAVLLKKSLELRGAKIKIKEGSTRATKPEAIPGSVRHGVRKARPGQLVIGLDACRGKWLAIALKEGEYSEAALRTDAEALVQKMA